MRLNRQKMKLRSIIRWGRGLTPNWWIDAAKKSGHTVLLVEGGAEFWK